MAEALNTESIGARLAAIDEHVALLADYLDPEGLEAEVAEFEQVMQQPGFWDDQDKAASVSADHARVQRKLRVSVPSARKRATSPRWRKWPNSTRKSRPNSKSK